MAHHTVFLQVSKPPGCIRMYKVDLKDKASSNVSKGSEVILPGDFGTTDFTEYLNSINNTHKKYRFFTNSRLWSTEDRLSTITSTEEDILLVEYEEERTGRVVCATSSFPDWIKKVTVTNDGVFSGGYDGAVRKGDEVLYEFGSPVQALTSADDLLLAASESEIVCLYANGTKKVKPTHHLSCLLQFNRLGIEAEGVAHCFYSGHFDGSVREWRLSKKKGFVCVKERQVEGSVNEILASPIGLVIVTSERVYFENDVLFSSRGFHCAATFNNYDNNDHILVTGAPDGTLSLFNLDTRTKRTSSKPNYQIKWISSVTFLTSERIASTGHDGFVRIWNNQMQLLQSIPVSPGKKLLTCYFYRGHLYVAGEECIVKSIHIF